MQKKDFYICSMRYLYFLFAVLFFSCASSSKKKSIHDQITGNWFVLYPDEDLNNEKLEAIYARTQDSLVTLKGVKLISFYDNGTFMQWDSIPVKGRWGTVEEKIVVNGAGKGFDNFKARFSGVEDGVLKLDELLLIEGEQLKLTWHLKKITGGKAADLFTEEKNSWRKVPVQDESIVQIKKRLSAMLSYYAVYFSLIAEESSYFMPIRVMLPLKFYQHAIGMKPYDDTHRFVSLFYSPEQAKQAYELLKEVVNGSDENYKQLKSYSEEYAIMLEKMAEDMVK